MNNQIDKLQMLIALEKGIFIQQYRHQKKLALLTAMSVAFGTLVILSINVALFCHLSNFGHFAQSAWMIAGLNGALALIPCVLMCTNRNKTASEEAAENIREALLDELKSNFETSYIDVKKSIVKIQSLSKDLKTFSEGGLTSLIPLIKLISSVVDDKIGKTTGKPKTTADKGES